MFNLEQAIADWRRHLAGAGIESADVLDELESHLRDDVAQDVRSGATDERAFESAIARFGEAAALGEEFAKSGQGSGASSKAFLRIFYFIGAALAIVIDLWTLISFELSAVERIAGACGVAGFGWYLFRLPSLPWCKRGTAHPRFGAAMKAMGIIVPLWTLWALLTALRAIRIEIGIIPQMAVWSICAAYGLTALACVCFGVQGGDDGSGGWLPPGFPAPQPVPPGRPSPPGISIPGPRSVAFAPLAQRALELAREEAERLGHDYIGTEHVLLGVLRSPTGALARALQTSQVNGEAVRAEIHRLVSPLPARAGASVLPLTPRARKALRLAGTEAGALEHPLIRPEHIVIGLLREGSGVAALALKNLGIRPESLRAEVSSAADCS